MISGGAKSMSNLFSTNGPPANHTVANDAYKLYSWIVCTEFYCVIIHLPGITRAFFSPLQYLLSSNYRQTWHIIICDLSKWSIAIIAVVVCSDYCSNWLFYSTLICYSLILPVVDWHKVSKSFPSETVSYVSQDCQSVKMQVYSSFLAGCHYLFVP